MASIWLYIGAGFLSLVLGAITVFILYSLFNFIVDLIKHSAPKKAAKAGKLKEYIAQNQEFFKADLGKELDEKEVEENERREFERAREFEKLRRIASTSSTGTSIQSITKSPERRILPDGNVGSDSRINSSNSKTKRSIKLND